MGTKTDHLIAAFLERLEPVLTRLETPAGRQILDEAVPQLTAISEAFGGHSGAFERTKG